MTTAELQKLALSQVVYNDLPQGNNPTTGNPWTIGELIRADYIEDASYNSTTDTYTFSAPQLSALSGMLDWTLANFQPNTSTGFAGAAFQDSSDELVFAFRGTEFFTNGFINGINDIAQDIEIAMGEESHGQTQFDDAFDFWTSTLIQVGAGNYDGYSFTGHSLGGGLAQYMTYMTNEVGHSVTFNAVGIGQSLSGVNPSDYNDSIVDYVNENDIVGMYGIQLGQTKYIQDHGNHQINSDIDIFQLALRTAVLGAMERGDITQTAGLAALNGITEVGQGIGNGASDVFFGAHSLDTFFTSTGNVGSEVSGPNLAILALTKAIQGTLIITETLVDGVQFFLLEIPFALGEATAKVSIAIVEGGAEVLVTIGSTVWSWVNFMGEMAAEIIYNTAVAIGDTAEHVAEVAVMYPRTIPGIMLQYTAW